MQNKCLDCGECRQYCDVLNGLTEAEVQAEEACEWPEQLEQGYDFAESAKPELAQAVGRRLLEVLSTGNRVRNQLETPGTELAVAYQAHKNVFSAQLNLWTAYASAAEQGRIITDIEVEYYTQQLQEALRSADTELRLGGVSAETLTHAQAIHDRETIEDTGLLFDESMLQTVTGLCANASSSKSTLLIGDKGIAKTQAAKFTSALFAPDGKARFISGDGSMMKDEFMGKMTLTEQNGATVTTFQPGILTECMKEGVPLVMDEINLIDPAIAMRLQDILLRKPGDVVTIQEDSGEQIVVKHGFCVFATANEASTRYQSRATLDPAFRDRFVVLPIAYPDGDTAILQATDRPVSLARLAYAFAVSRNGIASKHITPRDALWLSSVAHASQQLYSKPARDVQSGPLGTNMSSVIDDGEPRMNDCITPRKMVDILQAVAKGLNPYDGASGVRGLTMNVVGAMQRSEDRQTMFEVVRLMHDNPNAPFDEAAAKKRLRI